MGLSPAKKIDVLSVHKWPARVQLKMSSIYLVISPVVMSLLSILRTVTAAVLKIPPPPCKGLTPAAKDVLFSMATDNPA